MRNEYQHTKTTVSLIKYHFVFCPRYRRKIFKNSKIENRFKELTAQECERQNIVILAMECHTDYVYMFVNSLPTQSPADIMNWIKGASSNILRSEFKELNAMPSLWTRNYFVSTADNISSETIKRYVNTQKTRP